MVFGLLQQMLNWKMQNHLFFCGRTTCSEIIFSCREIKAHLFSNAVSILDIRCSVESKKSRTIFFELNFWRKDIFRKEFCVSHCSIYVYLFSCIVFGLNQAFYQNLSWLEVKTSFSMSFCEGTSISEANSFNIAWGTLFFQKSFLSKPKVWHHVFDQIRMSEKIFSMLICKQKTFQTLYFCSRHCQTYFKLFFEIKIVGLLQVV